MDGARRDASVVKPCREHRHVALPGRVEAPGSRRRHRSEARPSADSLPQSGCIGARSAPPHRPQLSSPHATADWVSSHARQNEAGQCHDDERAEAAPGSPGESGAFPLNANTGFDSRPLSCSSTSSAKSPRPTRGGGSRLRHLMPFYRMSQAIDVPSGTASFTRSVVIDFLAEISSAPRETDRAQSPGRGGDARRRPPPPGCGPGPLPHPAPSFDRGIEPLRADRPCATRGRRHRNPKGRLTDTGSDSGQGLKPPNTRSPA